jgi:hypothetical protein
MFLAIVGARTRSFDHDLHASLGRHAEPSLAIRLHIHPCAAAQLLLQLMSYCRFVLV